MVELKKNQWLFNNLMANQSKSYKNYSFLKYDTYFENVKNTNMIYIWVPFRAILDFWKKNVLCVGQ